MQPYSWYTVDNMKKTINIRVSESAYRELKNRKKKSGVPILVQINQLLKLK